MFGNKEVFANNLQYYMMANNKTRKDVCDDLDMSYTTFCDWVNAKKYPRIDKIEQLANYFNCKKSDLIESAEEAQALREAATVIFGKNKDGEELLCVFNRLNDEHRRSVIDYAKCMENIERGQS